MISIKGGAELLIYGGSVEGVQSGIWKYQVVSGKWTQIGDLFKGR